MKKIITLILGVMLTSSVLMAVPASPDVATFKQADGTSFEGILKGNAFFNWIESDGNVVLYNAKDKTYYKAVFDEEKGLVMGTQKVQASKQKSSSFQGAPSSSATHGVSKSVKAQLKVVQEKKMKELQPY